MDLGQYRIGDLSKQAGVSRRTIHYYINRGMIPPAGGAGISSFYTDDHLKRVLLIKKLQAGRMPLEQIRAMVNALDYSETTKYLDDVDALIAKTETSGWSIQKPTRQPVKESAQKPYQEPYQEPAQEPYQEPAKQPTKEAAQELFQDLAKLSVQDPSEEPVKEPSKKSLQQARQKPILEPPTVKHFKELADRERRGPESFAEVDAPEKTAGRPVVYEKICFGDGLELHYPAGLTAARPGLIDAVAGCVRELLAERPRKL